MTPMLEPRRTFDVIGALVACSLVIGATSCGRTPPLRAVPVAFVDVDPGSATVPVGESVRFKAKPEDSEGDKLSGRSVTWSSSHPEVATVDKSGLVSGQAVGAATITAKCEGVAGTAEVAVTEAPVAMVEMSPPSVTITVGASVQLTATPKDARGNPLPGRSVEWTSSSDSVATVGAGGLVAGLSVGTATITATSEGMTGTATITVTPPPPPPPSSM